RSSLFYCLCFLILFRLPLFSFFFYNALSTTEIYTLSLHDALPISSLELNENVRLDSDLNLSSLDRVELLSALEDRYQIDLSETRDRKSTRLNSSHRTISYAVFCLKKKKKNKEKSKYKRKNNKIKIQ